MDVTSTRCLRTSKDDLHFIQLQNNLIKSNMITVTQIH